MAANEIPERIAAHAVLRLAPKPGDVDALEPSSISFRSQVGFSQVVVTSTNASAYPLLILTLDRELSRAQNQVLAYLVGNVDALGRSYPQPAAGASPRLPNVECIHTSWIGNYAAPSWLPFANTPVPNPTARRLAVFNAVAILLPAAVEEGELSAYAGDLCVLVLRSPVHEGTSHLLPILPLPLLPLKTWIYDAPSLIPPEGETSWLLPEWPDTGTAPLQTSLPIFANLPTAASPGPAVLNSLQTVRFVSGGPVSGETTGAPFWTRGEGYSVSVVCALGPVSPPNLGVNQNAFFLEDDDGASLSLHADFDGNWYLSTDGDAVNLGPQGTAFAMAVSVSESGDYSVRYCSDWGATQTLNGTFSTPVTEPTFFYTAGGANTIYLGRLMGRNRALSGAELDAELSALRATWEPLGPFFVRFLDLNAGAVAESGDGVTGWVYTPISNATAACTGDADHYLPDGQDGSIVARFNGSLLNWPAMQMNSAAAPTASQDANAAVVLLQYNTNIYAGRNGGSFEIVAATPSFPFYGRIARVGTDVELSISPDGVSWTLVKTYNAVTGDLWPGFTGDSPNNPQSIGPYTYTGLVPYP